MPFCLKNVGATYKRLVNQMFKKQIERIMEVYANNLLVKSKVPAQNLKDLKEGFIVLRQYKMK